MASSSPWNKIESTDSSLHEIMNEQYVQGLENKRVKKHKEEKFPIPKDEAMEQDEIDEFDLCKSDEAIAWELQSGFDIEYNDSLKRYEKTKNKNAKISICYDKYILGDGIVVDDIADFNEDAIDPNKHHWDRFETNKRQYESIPKSGFKMFGDGSIITKHDLQLCGVKNACKVMSFPPEFQTGDAAAFDMKLSNKVFNQLKTYSQKPVRNKMVNKKENTPATPEMRMDDKSRKIMERLVKTKVINERVGFISTGKEALVSHGTPDTKTSKNLPLLPKEFAIKIFKTTLNDYKQRDRYIKEDFRFKDRFSKQNDHDFIDLWAEKETLNLIRMQECGINCPEFIFLKHNVIFLSFIGLNNVAAPKLKNANLSDDETVFAYEKIVEMMIKMYNEAKLVHADLSEYNILWFDHKPWFIDVAQSVEPFHPSALEFQMRDCNNIITVSSFQ